MTNYQFDDVGVLFGPVVLRGVPGMGSYLPSNIVPFETALPAPEPDHVWVLVDGEAHQLEDHRGPVYRTETGEAEHHSDLGPLPDGYTATPKPSPTHHWQDGGWINDQTSLHATKVIEINNACMVAITGGFWSSSLGKPHQYSSELDDQLNLTGVILAGLDSPYACRDEQGVKEFRPHTFTQLRRVGDDFTLFKLQLLQRANALKQQLDQGLAANDVDALEAIRWESLT
ncbi:DUF4376 domain-containing protein [Pseudomonas sp. GT1P32]